MLTLLFSMAPMTKVFFAFIVPFGTMILLGNTGIRKLKQWQGKGQPIRADGPSSHFAKEGVPSMGGVLVIITALLSSILFVKMHALTIGIMLITIGYAGIGFMDDYLKISKQNTYKGLGKRLRLILESCIALLAVYIMMHGYPLSMQTALMIPYYQLMLIPLSVLYYIFASFVAVGTANAVNLTDGLDGLASKTSVVVLGGIAFLALFMGGVVGNAPYIPAAIDVAIMASGFMGALLGFLWFNTYPAKVFMGDCGSLGIGGAIAAMAIAIKHELFLVIAGIIFIIEAGSSFLQIIYFHRTKGKRLFRMAPLHHHYEKKGLPETRITDRFMIITIMAVVLALMGEYWGSMS